MINLARTYILAFLFSLFLTHVYAATTSTIIMDVRDGRAYKQSNADKKMNAGPLTQLMTLSIAFEAISSGQINPDTTIDLHTQFPFPSWALKASKVSFLSLVHDLVLNSSAFSADIIASTLENSSTKFVQRMNLTARALSMTNTHFVDPHGLSSAINTTSASDLALLARHIILNQSEFSYLFTASGLKIEGVPTTRKTKPFFINYFGAQGLMEAKTNQHTYNQVAVARKGNKQILVILLGYLNLSDLKSHTVKYMDLGFLLSPFQAPEIKPKSFRLPEKPIVNQTEYTSKPLFDLVINPTKPSLLSKLPKPAPIKYRGFLPFSRVEPPKKNSTKTQGFTIVEIQPPPISITINKTPGDNSSIIDRTMSQKMPPGFTDSIFSKDRSVIDLNGNPLPPDFNFIK